MREYEQVKKDWMDLIALGKRYQRDAEKENTEAAFLKLGTLMRAHIIPARCGLENELRDLFDAKKITLKQLKSLIEKWPADL